MAGDPAGREPVPPGVPDVGTVGGWGIPGDDRPGMGMVLAESGDEPPAIVTAGSVLPGDRLQCRGNDNVGVGMDEGATHHPVPAGPGSVPVVPGTTGGTMDPFGTEMAGPVKGQQAVAVQGSEMFQGLGTLQAGRDGAKGRAQMDGIDPAGTFPEAGVRRGPATLKRALRLKATAGSPALPRAFRSNCRSEDSPGGNTAMPDSRQSLRVKRRCLTESGMDSKTLPAKADGGHETAR